MKTELWYLVLVTALTSVLWVPYILDRVLVWGLADAVGYPPNPKPQSPWAQRLMKAHGSDGVLLSPPGACAGLHLRRAVPCRGCGRWPSP